MIGGLIVFRAPNRAGLPGLGFASLASGRVVPFALIYRDGRR